jgi:predicted PurR-regulated permease PerM
MAAPTRLTLTEYVQRVLATVAVVGLALLLWRWLDVLLLAFGAVIVAVILRALADPIGRYARLNERVSLLVAVLVFLGLLVGGLWLFGSTIADQLYQLGQALPSAWAKIKPQLAGLPFGPQLLATVSGFETGASPDQATPLSEGVIAQIRGALVQLGGFARSTLGVVADILVVVIAGVYLAAEPEVYRNGVLMLLPEAARAEVRAAVAESGRALRLWLFSTLCSMVFVGVLTGIGAAILGLPAPAALGLIAGIAQFVPIVGPMSSILPGALVAIGFGPQTLVWTLIVYISIQQVESNIFTPLVQRRTVKLPPALTLFSLIAMALLFGPLGVVFATPLTVVAFVMVRRLYIRDVIGEDVDPDEDGTVKT